MSRDRTDARHPGAYALFLRFDLPQQFKVRRADRQAAINLLRRYRREVPFAQRQSQIAEMRSLAPLGTTRFDIRMGRGHA